MGVPIVYRKGQSQALSNYDYVDIATGTGYIKLYAGKTISGASTANYALSNITYFSVPVYIDKTGTSSVYQKLIDLDFDVLLNKPMTFRGNAIVQVPIQTDNFGAASTIAYAIPSIKKWDGTTETLIATTTSGAHTLQDTHGEIFTYSIPIPLTSFKKGETLRLTIEGWAVNNTGDTAGHIRIYHDPMSRETDRISGANTQLILQMPVRITL